MIEISASAEQIGFCADIHGAYDHVLAMREQRPDVEHWFCAGDVVDMHEALHYNQPTLRIMHQLGIPSVMGNHDYRLKKAQLHRLDKEARTYLSELPFRLDIQFAEQRICIYHATPESREDFALERAGETTFARLFGDEEADIIVVGHTHTPYVKTHSGMQFINPGALGAPEVPPSFCVFDRSGLAEIVYLNS